MPTAPARKAKRDFASLFAPRSVAVVGASEEVNRFGGAALNNILMHRFAGRVYAVNPNRKTVLGVRAYPSVGAIGEPVDSAVIAVGADGVLDVLRQCEAAGIRSAIVVSSGFSEGAAGPEGRRRAEQLQAFLAASSLSILGPSTTGLFNLHDRYVPRAAANQLSPDRVQPGPLALVSQSGAINNIVYNRAQQRGVGVGFGAATGVQMMLDLWDIADGFIEDQRVRTIALVIEQFGPGERCRRTCLAAQRAGKSVIALKLGRTRHGAAAVQTHSGAIAGEWEVQRSALAELGVLIAEDLDQICEIASMLQHWGPPKRGAQGGVGVLAFSGGEGALLADVADDLGLALPKPSEQFRRTVASTLPLAECTNPFDPSGDVIGRDDRFVATVKAWLTENRYDAFLMAGAVQGDLLRGAMQRVSAAIAPLKKPIMVSYWRVRGLSEGIEEVLRQFPGPVFDSSLRALRAYERYLRGSASIVGGEEDRGSAHRRMELPRGATYWEVRAALQGEAIAFPAARLATSADAAVVAAEAIGYPVVIKANVASTTHKSAAGLVRIGLTGAQAVRAAAEAIFARLPEAGRQLVVEGQAAGEVQVFVGARRDPEFGPVIVFGTGGVAVEYLADSATALARGFDLARARALVRRTRIGRFLADRSPTLHERLVVLLRQVAADFVASGFAGLDLNPVLVRLDPPALLVVDARLD